MILREELFEQTEGQGILELRGGPLENVLFLNDEPLVYDAANCKNSQGRFAILLSPESNLPIQVQIERAAERGFDSESSLSEQIAPLLQLMSFGMYRLTLEEISTQQILVWEERYKQKSVAIMEYYPHGQTYGQTATLITTRPDFVLSDERVNFYIDQIQTNIYPTLLVLGAKGQHTSFIIDGQNKLFAYTCLNIKPRMLRIECSWRKMVSHFVAAQILDDVGWDGVLPYLRRRK